MSSAAELIKPSIIWYSTTLNNDKIFHDVITAISVLSSCDKNGVVLSSPATLVLVNKMLYSALLERDGTMNDENVMMLCRLLANVLDVTTTTDRTLINGTLMLTSLVRKKYKNHDFANVQLDRAVTNVLRLCSDKHNLPLFDATFDNDTVARWSCMWLSERGRRCSYGTHIKTDTLSKIVNGRILQTIVRWMAYAEVRWRRQTPPETPGHVPVRLCDGMLPLHPRVCDYIPNDPNGVDVVLIHGLLGVCIVYVMMMIRTVLIRGRMC